jgi:hypothetical protein
VCKLTRCLIQSVCPNKVLHEILGPIRLQLHDAA